MTSGLRSEIQQAAPFQSPEQEAFLNLVRTAAVLEHAVSERLKPHGLTLTQYNALRILRGAGSEGLCRNDVRARMLRPMPDATRLLDRLADVGLVARDRDGMDRRYVTARITREGLELLAGLDGPLATMHAELLGHIPPDRLHELSELLEEARSRG
jgi:DNA-binding MarR family transcriptional regulator